MTLDFTLEKYKELCQTIRDLCCPIMTVTQFLTAGQSPQCAVVLRHDVDRGLGCALRMAELEMSWGIQSTYYIRAIPAVFRADAIQRLERLGHEVGYHYETLAQAKGDLRQAVALFEHNLARFRQLVQIDTISMHGSPLTPWNNLDLWKAANLGDYGLLGDAILGLTTQDLYYFTDTGRCWDAGRHNIRDHVPSRAPDVRVHTTDELIAFLKRRPEYPIYINMHPNRWAGNLFEWLFGWAFDSAANAAKRLISARRQMG